MSWKNDKFKYGYSVVAQMAPCKDCKRRSAYCRANGSCEAWNAYEAAKAEERERRRKQMQKPWELDRTVPLMTPAYVSRKRDLDMMRKRGRVSDR